MSKSEQITAIIQQLSGKDSAPAPDEALFESGYLDSFALPDLISELEQKFSFKVPDSDIGPRKFESVDRIVEYVDSHS
jgi:acyl carrier protein